MRFEVPQFIDIEDKIFGQLTWRQFVYLGGGLGGAVVMFLTLPTILAIVLGLPLALLAGALAFYPINNRPFSFFLEALYNYFTSDKLYQWKHKSDVVYSDSRPKENNIAPTVQPGNRGNSHKSISSLTRTLELQAMQKPDA